MTVDAARRGIARIISQRVPHNQHALVGGQVAAGAASGENRCDAEVDTALRRSALGRRIVLFRCWKIYCAFYFCLNPDYSYRCKISA